MELLYLLKFDNYSFKMENTNSSLMNFNGDTKVLSPVKSY